jgi:hypothetical protein
MPGSKAGPSGNRVGAPTLGVWFIVSLATSNVGCLFIQHREIQRATHGTFDEQWTVAQASSGRIPIMSDFRFSVIVPTPQMTHDEILDATEAFGNSGCTDASIRGHTNGMELLFERVADSLQAAISSAIADVERAGYRVSKVELERAAIPG